jgi:predicted aspartyl protease
MKRILITALLFSALNIIGLTGLKNASAADFNTAIPMQDKGAHTYYIPAHISGFGATELMVDTGSGYMTINEETLKVLKKKQNVHYVKDLIGILANGAEMHVPVYRISAVNLGGRCWLHDVDAAVFPGKQRLILGLSALTKAAPFIFSVNPPQLVLSNCGAAGGVAVAD